MNYEDMSDFEINKLVSKNTDFGELVVSINDSNETVYLCEKDGTFSIFPISHFDPCNNPSDAWPIILGNNISILKSGNEWMATWSEYGSHMAVNDIYVSDKNPLRSAMICFLKMKDAEQCQQ